MQHVSGNMSQVVINDYGPFIKIKEFRFRKDLILFYGSKIVTDLDLDDKSGQKILHLLYIHYSQGHSGFNIICNNEEELKQYIYKLDELFEAKPVIPVDHFSPVIKISPFESLYK